MQAQPPLSSAGFRVGFPVTCALRTGHDVGDRTAGASDGLNEVRVPEVCVPGGGAVLALALYPADQGQVLVGNHGMPGDVLPAIVEADLGKRGVRADRVLADEQAQYGAAPAEHAL